MRRLGLVAVFIVLQAQFAMAKDVIPESRFVVTPDMDFYGADLTTLFDSTFKTCRRACESNAECLAFTYNSQSSACFPKSSIKERKSYKGAYSAERILASPESVVSAQARALDLDFLSAQDLKAAYDQAISIGGQHPSGGRDLDQLTEAAHESRAQNNATIAMRWAGMAVSLADRSELWAEYGHANMALFRQNKTDRTKNAQQALSAFVNAYLRASDKGARASALSAMAQALEIAQRGRDMIPALRLAQSIQPRDDIALRLAKAIGKYGFRIAGHNVDSDAAQPRVCAEFTEQLIKTGVDYEPFVRLPESSLVVQPDGRQLCIDGVTHGTRYRVTFRTGLPAANGEVLSGDVTLDLYVRDRSPSVRFPGRAYILPSASTAALPVETVNLESLELRLRRISDRNILRAIQDSYFGRPLSHYQEQAFASDIAEDIWTGTADVQAELNRDVTTRLPVDDMTGALPAGIYALTAKIAGADPYDDPGATQWFVVSDLGLSTQLGSDGLHVTIRALSDTTGKQNVDVTLVSRANAVLGTVRTDAEGYAKFPAGLTRGTGASAPALVMAQNGENDFTFLSLLDPAFDLSDRGVEGRPPAPPVDTFATTDRGAYRVGETVHVTALTRDHMSLAIVSLPLTAILTRPDGVEYSRQLSTGGVAGGHVFAFELGETVPRGTWRIDYRAEQRGPVLATSTILVEDFLPERIDLDLNLPVEPLVPGQVASLSVKARYLFGAPGEDLPVEGEVTLQPTPELARFPGFAFGRYDTRFDPRSRYLNLQTRTDENGELQVPLELPDFVDPARPLEAQITVRVSEGTGRPVERRITRAIAPAGPMIGLKPLFKDVAAEGGSAGFEVIAVGTDMKTMPMPVRWTLNRLETRYEWYQIYGNWNWEPTTTRKRVATGEATLGAVPAMLELSVDWGQYELVVERMSGGYVASALTFYAGWYAQGDVSSTPDTLDVSLDQSQYSPGDTAKLRVTPRYDGTGLITVMSGKVIARKAVALKAGENVIPLKVTADWGAGAYATVLLLRPMNNDAGQNPARALGLTYARISPGSGALDVKIASPEVLSNFEVTGGKTRVSVSVEGVQPGEPAYVTLAAIDVGILNLTGFQVPDPTSHYFGQRRLGVDLRDVYGRLINGMNGAMGIVRSGGDAGNRMRRQSPPPMEKLMAFFSGPVAIGPDGKASIEIEIPKFNGTVRMMAVAWSNSGVGSAHKDMTVRDPVVITATAPRFLAPGDQSRLTLDVVHVDGKSGQMQLNVSGIGLDLPNMPELRNFDLREKEKKTFSIPITAQSVGDYSISFELRTPDGIAVSKSLVVPVRVNDPEVASTRRLSLDAGDTFTFDNDLFADLRPGTASAALSSGSLAGFNAPRLLTELDRFPYGCTEQITSTALPLLYLGSVAQALDLGDGPDVTKRIALAIDHVLTRQASDGGFGLWRADSGDFWLDAYVTDFLSRARTQGHQIPDIAFRLAMDNLRNRINYAPDFDSGGEDIAYALLVLAREGAAAIGDLRYYADTKASAFDTPLAAGQLGAALATYGDQTRADRMFAYASKLMNGTDKDEAPVWRADYGSNLRDAAGLLSLAVEYSTDAVDREALASRITSFNGTFSTQEAVWTLLAAHALSRDVVKSGLSMNGRPLRGPLAHLFDEKDEKPIEIQNTGSRPTQLTLTTFGVPKIPQPAGGYGFVIERSHYTMDGDPIELPARTGTRYVTVLKVVPLGPAQARLMVNDPLPAGLEIDNPNLLRSGDVRALDWLTLSEAKHSEFRSDRFLAAVDLLDQQEIVLAYVVRAVSPGTYHHPSASVEDMYRPRYRAWSDPGQIVVVE